MSDMRERVVTEARSWIGTPYHHQASRKQVGCDCLGLVRGVYREFYGHDGETPPPYSPGWAEATGRETMIEAARRHLREINPKEATSGDILIFRLRQGAVAKHAAVMVSSNRMVHAVEGAPVCEVHIGRWWRRHLAAAFSFPEIV